MLSKIGPKVHVENSLIDAKRAPVATFDASTIRERELSASGWVMNVACENKSVGDQNDTLDVNQMFLLRN